MVTGDLQIRKESLKTSLNKNLYVSCFCTFSEGLGSTGYLTSTDLLLSTVNYRTLRFQTERWICKAVMWFLQEKVTHRSQSTKHYKDGWAYTKILTEPLALHSLIILAVFQKHLKTLFGWREGKGNDRFHVLNADTTIKLCACSFFCNPVHPVTHLESSWRC